MAKSWIEVSASAITHNFRCFRNRAKPAQVMAVLKANAYGHGLLLVAKILDKAGARWFAVDHIEEALLLRERGFKQSILVLGYIPLNQIQFAVKQDISFVAYQEQTIVAAQKAALKARRLARIHLKLETGLHRQGVDQASLPSLLALLQRSPQVLLEGISTHFANIEERKNDAYSLKQLKTFDRCLKIINEHRLDPKYKHAACSAAIIRYPEQARYNAVRVGIGLYGEWSSKDTEKRGRKLFALKPALTWKTMIAQIKAVPSGSPVSYGLKERTKRHSRIAVLPIGYSDGFDRVGMSGRGEVLVRGRRCKVIGRVCMNMCMVDVTGVPEAKPEDEVVLLGKQKKQVITANELAEKMDSIHYEVLARLGFDLPRLIVR